VESAGKPIASAIFFGLRSAQTVHRVDQFGDDFLGRAVCHFFNVHAAFAGRDERDLLAGTVGHQGHVVLF